jgi:hypothetical protein
VTGVQERALVYENETHFSVLCSLKSLPNTGNGIRYISPILYLQDQFIQVVLAAPGPGFSPAGPRYG